MSDLTPAQQLDEYLSKYDPVIEKIARAALDKLRALLPGAVQMVYDNYNTLAIGFGSTEKPSEATFSVALYPKWVTLFFLKGNDLPDPQKTLKGSGVKVRSVRLEDAKTLSDPALETLLDMAIAASTPPFGPAAQGKLIIKSISERQRPRRPT